MWSKITERWMPHRRRKSIIDAILRSGVLRSDRKWWAGGPNARSIGYGLAEPYWGKRYRPRRLRPWEFDCPELARRVRVRRNERREDLRHNEAVLFDHLHDLALANGTPIRSIRSSAHLRKLAGGECLFYITSPNGRFFSAFTCMKRTHRYYLRLRGRELFGVDIKNAQPVLLGLVLKERGGDAEQCSRLFRELSLRGVLCEEIMAACGCDDRKTVKRKLMVLMFGDRENMDLMRHPTRGGFEKLFPELYR
jgi:hypothetical protein